MKRSPLSIEQRGDSVLFRVRDRRAGESQRPSCRSVRLREIERAHLHYLARIDMTLDALEDRGGWVQCGHQSPNCRSALYRYEIDLVENYYVRKLDLFG